MQDYIYFIIVALVVFIVAWFIISQILKRKQFKQNETRKLPIDIEDVIVALGGKDNIKETVANGSKVTFFLNDDHLVKSDDLKKLGASGIVQMKSKLTVIFGKFSDQISNEINNKL